MPRASTRTRSRRDRNAAATHDTENDAPDVVTDGASSAKEGDAACSASRDKEKALWDKGNTLVFGVDEAGRGPLAGPVVAAACSLPPDVSIPGVTDSKQLTHEEREALYARITSAPGVIWAAHVVDAKTIDRINILEATKLAMREAVVACGASEADGHYILIDGNQIPKGLPAPAQAIVQGDRRCFCIAAASIIAKVTRDRLMLEFHKQFPQFNFAQHKGYGVEAHMEALAVHGPCEIHRRSFQPIRGMTGWTREQQLAEEAAAAAATACAHPKDKGLPHVIATAADVAEKEEDEEASAPQQKPQRKRRKERA